MNRRLIVIFLLFIITRFLFLANFPHFYDSPEYLQLAQEKNLIMALKKSHESIHPIYILLIQTTNKLYHFIDFKDFIDFTTIISFVSAFFGFLTFICFYYLVKRLFNRKIAFFSLIPLIFFPHLWLMQTNIMHEAVDHFFLITSLLFFDIFLTNKKFSNLIFSLLFFLLAVFNFVGNFIWIPVFFGLSIFRKTKKAYDSN